MDSSQADVPDARGLLDWKSADRATFTVQDVADAADKSAALTSIVRAWIEHV